MTNQGRLNKPERMKRGSFPPYISLGEAFALVRLIYEQGGGQASYDLMSRLTANSSSSSSFIKKTGALKLYGLVTEQNGNFLLTEQGNTIAAPISENSDSEAKKSAFLSVPPFARLFERHKGKLVPADEFLKNILEQDVRVPRELSSAWIKAFKESAKAAGLLFSRPDGKTQILEFPLRDSERPGAKSEGPEAVSSAEISPQNPEVPARTVGAVIPSQVVPASVSGNNTRFELSDGQVAEFSIPFGIKSKDAKRLKSFLKGLEFFIDSAIVDDGGDST